ncbi:MAG: hypothetical protein ACOX0Z_02190 [Candidatus Nanosyncoccaceae bacterium]|jgi:Trk-type K+ transport system membrane component
MSSSKKISKRQFSKNFKITVLALVVLTAFVMVLILTTKWRTEVDKKTVSSSETDIEQSTSVDYDKNQILIDTTAEPLEIIELPSLEAK